MSSRLRIGVAILSLLVTSCSSIAANSPATTHPQEEPIASAPVSSMPSVTAAPPTSTTLDSGRLAGALPNGTTYTLAGEPLGDVRVESISAAVVVDLPNGDSPVIGNTAFLPLTEEFPAVVEDGQLRLTTGDWLVQIDAYDHIQDALGPKAEDILLSSITARSVNGLPVLDLVAPFRFASDDEVPLQMWVMYQDFVVLRGCDELGAVCNATRGVQVVPNSAVMAPVEDVPLPDPIFIESPIPRPIDDPHYLDPGPVVGRAGHTAVWTGEEMVVWGGATDDESGFLVDGALFDPVSSTWRMLPPAPLEPLRTLAVWTGQELIVVGSQQAASYTDDGGWRMLPTPTIPITPGAAAAWTEDQLLIWNGNQMVTYNPTADA